MEDNKLISGYVLVPKEMLEDTFDIIDAGNRILLIPRNVLKSI